MRSILLTMFSCLILFAIISFLPLIIITALRLLSGGLPVVAVGGVIIFVCQMLENRSH